MKMIFLVLALLLSSVSMACREDGTSGIVEENNIRIPVQMKRIGGLSEVQFNEVIDKVEMIYSPIARSMGANLKIERRWTDPKANASANRGPFPNDWNVRMFGGLARHSTITEDGFALVLCHEIGHHLGGAPIKSSNRWASNEGQADYFGVLKCLRKVFLNDDNAKAVAALNGPDPLVTSCSKTYKNLNERNICIRSGMAGHSLASFFAVVRGKKVAKFDTPDPAVVEATFDDHPEYQCRLDTFLQGSICDVSFNEDVSETDAVKGTCHKSLGHTQGLRPLCWYRPEAR